jgi:hypothetical protein
MMKSCKTNSPALSASRINPSQDSDYYSALNKQPDIISRNSAFCHRMYITPFLKQTPVIYLNTTNWLVFVLGTECVLCDVGTEVLYTGNTNEIHASVG